MYIGAASYASLFATAFSTPLSSGSASVSAPDDSTLTTVFQIDPSNTHLDSPWFEQAFQATWTFILRVVDVLRSWFMCWGPSLAWTLQVLSSSYLFIQRNPHPFHILGWSIFFGPIIILIPCLLVVELCIIVIFHLEAFLHGQNGETIPARFEFLKDYFIESRESLFASVEHWTATFNKWTVNYPALLVFWLLGAALGVFVLVGIWNGW